MNPWNSFLQTVFQFVKSLFGGVTKKMHRNAAILTMGATLIAVIPFTAVDFQGGGKNAIVAFAETQGGSDEDSLEETEDTALPETDGNVLEDETTADETSSSAENEADIETETETETQTETETETENTETKEESITEPAAGSENADTDHGPEEAVETETAAAADEVSGITQAEPETEVSGEARVQAAAEETVVAEEPAREAFTGYSESDYNVLLRIVQAEAGNCDIEGRVMVANVILNRVESGSFPNTITKVVYQKHQFSPVSNGSIKRCKVTTETVEAVERALAGEDLTDGALYFMNRRASSKKNANWFDRHLEFLFKHGNHEFFR